MMVSADYIVVGSGLTGATIARLLADAGREVVVVERRPDVGGNVFDHTHGSGIRVHTYGPHYFRTNADDIWQFVSRFAEFYRYEAIVKLELDGSYENWPLAASYVQRVARDDVQRSGRRDEARNFEEACLAMMPRTIYEKCVRVYTEKQWGVPAQQLDPELAGRFDVREDGEPRLVRHRFQGLPVDGYARFMAQMVRGLPVMLNVDYLKSRETIRHRRKLLFTGAIDEYFGFCLGRLRYRTQRREHIYVEDAAFLQPCGQVNNPGLRSGTHIRTLEWKHMMPEAYRSKIAGTLLTREYTEDADTPDRFEYPFPDKANAALFRSYQAMAGGTDDVLICGRLGEYRYWDMDQAIARAMKIAKLILEEE